MMNFTTLMFVVNYSICFCICLLSIGYGDMYPTTSTGRFVAIILMYCGLIVLALPISVLGSAFTEEYNKVHAPKPASKNNQLVSSGNSVSKGDIILALNNISEQVSALTKQLQDVATAVQSMDGNDFPVKDDSESTMNALLQSDDADGIELKEFEQKSLVAGGAF